MMAKYEITINAGESITKAIRELPDDGEEAILHLEPGQYHEKVEILRSHLTIEGSGADRTGIIWHDRAYEILPDGKKRGTFRTATVRTDGDYITLRGLSIRNDSSPREEAGQCIALYADGDFFTCEDCNLISYQDTLFTAPLPPKEMIKDGFIGPKQFSERKPQRHIYRRDRIYGDIDFIFGGAAAWFEQCDIIAVDGRKKKDEPYVAYCTAASTPEGQRFGYVFHECRFLGEGVPDQSVFLGRPWRSYAKTVFLECYFDHHIRQEAFHDWGKADFKQNGLYAVYPEPDFALTMQYGKVLTKGEAAEYSVAALSGSL